MARAALTPQEPKGPFPGSVSAGDLDYTYADADATEGNQFPGTGRELLLVRNAGASPQTFTIKSVADDFGREEDVSAYSLGAGEFAMFWIGAIKGWRQTDGQVYLDADSTDIKFAIVRIP